MDTFFFMIKVLEDKGLQAMRKICAEAQMCDKISG